MSMGPFYLCILLLSFHVYCEVRAAFLSKHLFSNMMLNPETFTLRFWFIEPSTIIGKVKVKFTKEQVTKAQRGADVWLYSLTSALDGGGWLTSCPGRIIPGNDQVPIDQEAGWD